MIEQRLPGEEEIIGKYRLIGILAEGGMARLYLAEQSGPQGFKKVVALKRVLPHLAGQPEFREMFLREAIVAARLDHPHIVTTYELGEVNGQYFISMEYLPGEDLLATVRKTRQDHPMPVEIAASIAQQCADALSYAHEIKFSDGPTASVVHRDVNPSNIVVTYHGEVKLLDFGIAKVRNSHADARSTNFKGKLSYSAPEQLAGEPLDGRADIFCLGIVLWECLTGSRLFAGPSEAARIEAIRSRAIVPPSTLRKEIPPELDEIVMKALNRDRNLRFPSAREFSDVLLGFLAPPTKGAPPRAIGAWLEGLFGSERAAIKRATAQGHDLGKNLAALHRMNAEERESVSSAPASSISARMRPVWSSDLARGSLERAAFSPELHLATPPVPAAPSYGNDTISDLKSEVRAHSRVPARASPHPAVYLLAGLLVLGLGVGIAAFLRPTSNTREAERVAFGSLEVKSEPAGAQILVDGEPTGLTTPATLRDLPIARPFEIRIEKKGYVVSPKTITLASSVLESQSFRLEPAAGIVRLTGITDRKASIYVDGVRVDANRVLELSLGTHEVRVESDQKLIASRTIEVVAGEQSIDLGTRRE